MNNLRKNFEGGYPPRSLPRVKNESYLHICVLPYQTVAGNSQRATVKCGLKGKTGQIEIQRVSRENLAGLSGYVKRFTISKNIDEDIPSVTSALRTGEGQKRNPVAHTRWPKLDQFDFPQKIFDPPVLFSLNPEC